MQHRRRQLLATAALWAAAAPGGYTQSLPPAPAPLPALPPAPTPLPALPGANGIERLPERAPASAESAYRPPSGGVLDLPLLVPGRIRFLGTFSMPEPWWSWGIGYAGNNQFVATNRNTGGVRLYNIPAIGGTATLAAEGATLPSWGASANGWIPGGTVRVNGRLIAGQFQMYDTTDTPWLFQSIADSLRGGWTAPQRPDPHGVPLRGLVGSFGVIPAAYRSLFNGHDLFAANTAGKSIIGNSTWGPSFMSFPSSAATGSGTVPSLLLMAYDSGGHRGGPLTGGKLLPEVATIAGGGIVPGTRTLIMFGIEPSRTCYGTGAQCNDPCSQSQGFHGSPYTAVVYAFDLRDLVAVRDRALSRSAVRPYGTQPGGVMGSPRGWALPGFGPCNTTYNKSGFFDPDTRRIYMTNQWHDSPVYVWQISETHGG